MSLGVLCCPKKHTLCDEKGTRPAFRLYGFAVLAICFSALCAPAQQVSTQQQIARVGLSKPQRDISEVVLYHQFFRHFLFLDRQLALRQQQQTLRQEEEQNSYRQKLHFGPDQFGKVRTTANTTEQAVARLDAQARQVVLAFRAQHPQISLSNPLPPPPAELAMLQKQRDDLIQNEITQLRGSLGAEDSQRLDSFLKTQFAPHLTVTFVGPPRPHNPAAEPLAPFERIR